MSPCLDKSGKPKFAYDNRTSAEKAKTKRQRENPTLDLRVYRCECGKYHLTRSPDWTCRGDEEAA